LVKIGEVIQSSSMDFVSEGYDLKKPPAIGSFVSAGQNEPYIIGIVQNVRVEPFDVTRPVLARGQDMANESDVFNQNPQLMDLLTVRFDCITVGTKLSTHIFEGYSTLPPMIHSFVYPTKLDILLEFVRSLNFIKTVLNTRTSDPDLLLIACVREIYSVLEGEEGQILAQSLKQKLVSELARDSSRLIKILQYLGD
jgi:hypothetical protein